MGLAKFYDVVLLPNRELSQLAITTSRKLNTLNPLFTLKTETCYPHLSLLMSRFDDRQINLVTEEISSISKTHNAISLKAMEYHESRGYFDVEYIRNHSVGDIQQEVVEKISPLRTNDGSEQGQNDLSAEEKDNLSKYGYKYVSDLFRPHVTLARFKDAKEVPRYLLPDINLFNGSFDRIGLFVLGVHNTCVCKIAEFNL